MKETDAIDEYILQHIDEESDYLKALYRDTHVKLLRPRMASGHLQGRMLKMFVRMIRPRQVLEIGTYSGYSALPGYFADPTIKKFGDTYYTGFMSCFHAQRCVFNHNSFIRFQASFLKSHQIMFRMGLAIFNVKSGHHQLFLKHSRKIVFQTFL